MNTSITNGSSLGVDPGFSPGGFHICYYIVSYTVGAGVQSQAANRLWRSKRFKI